jgi:F0F1-type ATP synthase membrane subunit b/b'
VEHAGAHGSIGDLIWPVFNFALFGGLLVYVLRGPIRDYFRDRTARVRDGLEAGARARREAEALRADLERDLADLPSMRERLKADLRATAEQVGAQLLPASRPTGSVPTQGWSPSRRVPPREQRCAPR